MNLSDITTTQIALVVAVAVLLAAGAAIWLLGVNAGLPAYALNLARPNMLAP